MSNLGFPMLSGKEGYSINSGPQNSVLLRIRPILEQAIATQQLTLRDPSHRKSTIKLNRNLDMGNSVLEGEVELGNAAIRTAAFVTDVQDDKDKGNFDARVFRIADMGSSCGPNCLANMQFMVEAIRKYERQAASSASAFSSTEMTMESRQVRIHLQAFFCDLPSNDFNTLFLHRQNDYYHLNEDAGCFTAAVAGTVYGRLFPPLSLHLVFSSCCLHWLSHSPKLVSTEGCTEWNKGKIWVDGPLSNKAAGKAYAEQWNKDFMAFLKSRYEEMVEGGMMFLIIPCRDDSLPPHQMQRDSCFRNLEISWQQLTEEGVLEQEDLDTFNIPKFLPNPREIRSALSSFARLRVQYFEVIEEAIGDNYWRKIVQDPEEGATKMDKFYRSAFWNVIEAHVGERKCEAIFKRFRKLLKESLKNQSSRDSYWIHPWSSYATLQLIKDA